MSLPVQAAGDGLVVLQRDVQPRVATRPSQFPDQNPKSVNTNAAERIKSVTTNGELSDGDFAGINTGATISRMIMPDGTHLHGLNNGPSQLPGMSAGHGGGGGGGGTNSIANSVNSNVSKGMGALNILTQGR
ncbi:hypothetical protein [Pseudomonas sp. R5(2019)]|uniref:hypothetical protein n=1 Tax=Pseudomonas sp. R5(2019) TaxID=2697566 RepID=UPI002114D3B3|nr:hypothetical protein [Pseudomonas sp. R5(2019)]